MSMSYGLCNNNRDILLYVCPEPVEKKSETVEAIDFVHMVAQYSLNLWAPLIHELTSSTS